MKKRWRHFSPYMGLGLVSLLASALLAYQLASGPLRADEKGDDPTPKKEGCIPGDWKKPVEATLTLPDGLLGPFNKVAGKIGATVSDPTISVKKKTKDCCDKDDNKITDGVTEISGTASVKITAKTIAVPGLGWSGSITVSGRFGSLTTKLALGVVIDADLTISGSLKKTTDKCKNTDCFAGDLSGNGNVSASITGTATESVRIGRRGRKRSVNVEVTPGKVNVNIQGKVSINEPNCGDKLTGKAGIAEIDFEAGLKFGRWHPKYKVVLYKGEDFAAG